MEAQRFTVVVDAVAGCRSGQGHSGEGRSVRGVASGTDAYRTPAVIAVEAAVRLASGPAPAPVGVLAPSQAFDPGSFLDFIAGYALAWPLEPAAAGGRVAQA